MRLNLAIIVVAASGLASSGWAVRYPEANRVKIEISHRVEFATSGTQFVVSCGQGPMTFTSLGPSILYVYEVKSLQESRLNIEDVGIEVSAAVGATILDATIVGLVTTLGRRFHVSPRRTLGPGWIIWSLNAPGDRHGKDSLHPGEGVGGLFLASRGLPGLRVFQAWGDVSDELPNVNDVFGDEDASTGLGVENPEAMNQASSGFRTVAVGPDVLPDDLSNKALVDRLIGLKDQIAGMGWIKDPGTVTSLNKKLASARKALDRWFVGKRNAREILRSFNQELEAQRGKHVDENAYALLRANADYLLEVRLK